MLDGKIIVTSYKGPDVDGYACMLAYEELLKSNGLDAYAGFSGDLGVEVKFVLNYLNIAPIDKIFSLNNFDSIVLVDSEQIEATELPAEVKKIKEVIDHHVAHKSQTYTWANVEIDLIGACATLVFERFLKENKVPTKNTAVFLYAGIISNTINLKNKITSERDIKAAKYLKELAEIPDDFVEKMFSDKSDVSGPKLKEMLKNDYYERDFFNKVFSVSQLELVGVNDLVDNRFDEMKNIIKDLTSEDKPDYQFLNLIDILDGYNVIIAFNQETEKLLNDSMGLNFIDGVSRVDHIIMRKEIIAKLKEYFEK